MRPTAERRRLQWTCRQQVSPRPTTSTPTSPQACCRTTVPHTRTAVARAAQIPQIHKARAPDGAHDETDFDNRDCGGVGCDSIERWRSSSQPARHRPGASELHQRQCHPGRAFELQHGISTPVVGILYKFHKSTRRLPVVGRDCLMLLATTAGFRLDQVRYGAAAMTSFPMRLERHRIAAFAGMTSRKMIVGIQRRHHPPGGPGLVLQPVTARDFSR